MSLLASRLSRRPPSFSVLLELLETEGKILWGLAENDLFQM